jgi:hypothetical protein
MVFQSTKIINNLLKNSILIDQSPEPLSNEAVEILCLGLNFIPKSPVAPFPQPPISRLVHNINTSLFFAQKNSSNHTKGWLNQFTISDWNPPIQSWMMDTRVISLLNSLSDSGITNNNIINKKILSEIDKLRNRQDIHILKSDKGRNTVLWLVKDYDREGMRQLNDKNTYLELSKDEYDRKLLDIQKQCHEMSENLLSLQLISPIEDEHICKRPPTGSAIYFLPKIHKNEQINSKTFPGRPIVATYSSVTYLLDKYITEITGHLLPLIPGSLIDTQDFLHKLPENPLPSGSTLLTADVTSLYPNIPWDEGIMAATEFYKDNLETLINISKIKKLRPPPQPILFKRILSLILTNSMIHFKNRKFFHQITGTAMGCCISFFFANSYMFT